LHPNGSFSFDNHGSSHSFSTASGPLAVRYFLQDIETGSLSKETAELLIEAYRANILLSSSKPVSSHIEYDPMAEGGATIEYRDYRQITNYQQMPVMRRVFLRPSPPHCPAILRSMNFGSSSIGSHGIAASKGYRLSGISTEIEQDILLKLFPKIATEPDSTIVAKLAVENYNAKKFFFRRKKIVTS
jgi:hypothetical protein